MPFDLTAVDNATLVFVGTLAFGLILAAFVLVSGLVALILLGAGKLTWTVVSKSLLAVVYGINSGWDRLVRHAASADVAGEFQAQSAPSTGTYPRVILRDS